MKKMYVYILLCSDDSYYTGVTDDINRRFAEHRERADHWCYTYSRCPLKIIFAKEFSAPKEAIAFEKRIKGWSRAKKEALVNEDWNELKRLAKNYTQYGHPQKKDKKK